MSTATRAAKTTLSQPSASLIRSALEIDLFYTSRTSSPNVSRSPARASARFPSRCAVLRNPGAPQMLDEEPDPLFKRVTRFKVQVLPGARYVQRTSQGC